jgi:hypothetical protein
MAAQKGECSSGLQQAGARGRARLIGSNLVPSTLDMPAMWGA